MEEKLPDSPTKSSTKYRGWAWSLLAFIMAVLVAIVAGLTLWDWYRKSKYAHDHHHHHLLRPPATVDDKYANALGVAMQFFEVQKCIISSMLFFFYPSCVF